MTTNNPHNTSRPGASRAWPRKAAAVAGALAAAAIVASGCSHGPSGPGVADVGSSSAGAASSPSSSASPDPLAFARCMRSHGVTDFPDSGGPIQPNLGSDLDPNNPTYKAARQACQTLLPTMSMNPAQQAQAYADDIKFAQCMRQHGITNYPDPNPNQSLVDLRAIDLNSPQFKSAQQACRQYQNPNGKGGN